MRDFTQEERDAINRLLDQGLKSIDALEKELKVAVNGFREINCAFRKLINTLEGKSI